MISLGRWDDVIPEYTYVYIVYIEDDMIGVFDSAQRAYRAALHAETSKGLYPDKPSADDVIPHALSNGLLSISFRRGIDGKLVHIDRHTLNESEEIN